MELELPEVLEVTDAEGVSELGGLAAEVTRLDELWPGEVLGIVGEHVQNDGQVAV